MPPENATAQSAPLTLKEKVRQLPRKPGCYLFRDAGGQVIYIGKAKDLKKRVSSYFMKREHSAKIGVLVTLIRDVETRLTRNETEALLLEGRLIKEWRPKFNTEFTDDRQFLQIRVDTAAEMPVFRLVRNRLPDNARYFGPYPWDFGVRQTLREMRRQFGILLADAAPRRLDDGRWQLYDDARAEISAHENIVAPADYRARVTAACDFLEGRSREWLEATREKMRAAADKRDYERAARLRDIVRAVENTTRKNAVFLRGNPLPAPDQKDAIRELQAALQMGEPPRTMECFDISHVSGTFVVASLVHFRDGRPDKSNYRRFKIKEHVGNDDFRSMREVVGRRYRRLRDEGREFPRLIVIDGGAGQVGAAMRAFADAGITPPFLVGLAKRDEQIIFPETDGRPPLTLPRHSPALQLVQRLRDEAHRFANTFNADLRSRRLRESVLDECPGITARRRMALLEHFGSLERLRHATAADIAALPGFGSKTAAAVVEFLGKLG